VKSDAIVLILIGTILIVLILIGTIFFFLQLLLENHLQLLLECCGPGVGPGPVLKPQLKLILAPDLYSFLVVESDRR